MREHNYFPLFFPSEGKKVLVAGGGRIAERRVRTLLQFRFSVTVASPSLTPGLQALCRAGAFCYRPGDYTAACLDGADLALACTDSPEANAAVCRDARARGILANRCDDRAACHFYFPAIAAGETVVAGLAGDGGDHGATRSAAERVREVLR